MKKLSLASVAMVALSAGGSALAADMPVKARPLPPPAVYSWTGFYVGGNVGYSWGRSSHDWNIYAQGVGGANSTGCPPGGFAFCATGGDTSKLNGAIGGFQAGYNWQIAPFLIGLEADFQASAQRRDEVFSTQNATNGLFFGNPVFGTTIATYTERLTWLGTLRARAGFASDRWLIYATGGLAYGRVTISGSVTAQGSNEGPGCVPLNPAAFTCPLANFSDGVNKAGWTVGLGAEGAITGNWSWKVEYLHIDLGTVSTTFATLPGCYGGTASGGGAVVANCGVVNAGTGTVSRRITDEIVRVGLNYRFGWGKAPVAVMAKY